MAKRDFSKFAGHGAVNVVLASSKGFYDRFTVGRDDDGRMQVLPAQDQTQSISNTVKNEDKISPPSIHAGPAAAVAGAGCSVVDGSNFGAGVMGVGLTFSDSSADKDFFVLCNNHAQVNEILSQDLCMGMGIAATDTGIECYRGNPMIRSYMPSGPGAARFAQKCDHKVTVTSLKPKGG